jgi:ADP-heptose:LPS heptosyltransferase
MTLIPKKILVIRNDKLGDFCLALPSFALLKCCFPHAELYALVPAYTQAIAEACPYIDHVIIDPGPQATAAEHKTLRECIKSQHFSAALVLYSTTRIGWLLLRCHIPIRFAPATKIAQFFYNHRVTQRRSRSLKPEYQYNLDLATRLSDFFEQTCENIPSAPYLQFSEHELRECKQSFCQQYHINHDKKLIFVHPGSGGSANNLNGAQYARLITKLASNAHLHFVISAGPGEYEQAHQVAAMLDADIPYSVYESRQGLKAFAMHIAFADLFVSGSTGPLHIAGALNRATAGFYTNRQSATSLRWQTLSADNKRLAFSPPSSAAAEDMSQVDLETAGNEIQQLLLRMFA